MKKCPQSENCRGFAGDVCKEQCSLFHAYINAGDCDIRIRIEPEFLPVDKHFDNPEDIKWVQEQLEEGNEMAWCIVIVSVKWMTMVEEVMLGGCSYKNIQDFQEGGYYQDMVEEAIDAIAVKAKAIAEAIS